MVGGTLEGTRELSVRVPGSYMPSHCRPGSKKSCRLASPGPCQPMAMPSHEEKDGVNRSRGRKARYIDTTSLTYQNATIENDALSLGMRYWNFRSTTYFLKKQCVIVENQILQVNTNNKKSSVSLSR
jgi:hypothetical protein